MTASRLNRDYAETDVRISSFCSGGACVGVRWRSDQVVVVDTKIDGGPPLTFSAAEWQAFVAGVKAGEFDRP